MEHLIVSVALIGPAAGVILINVGLIRLGVREPWLSLIHVASAIGVGLFFLWMTPLWHDLVGY